MGRVDSAEPHARFEMSVEYLRRSIVVAPRAYWKGFLRLSLVSCPIALFPATTSREKISFHQINKETGNRIKYLKVDAESGKDVPSEDIIKGYEVAKGEYVELDPEELEGLRLRASAQSTSMSSSKRKRSTNSTCAIPTTSFPMAK
jgi:non-homologous end joining protein Ku